MPHNSIQNRPSTNDSNSNPIAHIDNFTSFLLFFKCINQNLIFFSFLIIFDHFDCIFQLDRCLKIQKEKRPDCRMEHYMFNNVQSRRNDELYFLSFI